MARKTSRIPNLETRLQEIAEILVDSIPETVSRCGVSEPVYALILAYQDYSTDDFTPHLLMPPTSLRSERLASKGIEDGSCEIWMPMCLAEKVRDFRCEGPELDEKCHTCYDLLSQVAPASMDELKALKPFREMLYRVALALNRKKWDKLLTVAPDFVVVVSDWNGYRSEEDVPASIPAKKRDALKKQRLLFHVDSADPWAIAQERHKEFKSGNRRSEEEEMQFWLLQVERLFAGDPPYFKWFSLLWPCALECLQELGPQAALPLLRVVDKHTDKQSDDGYLLMGKALEAVSAMKRADDEIESLLLVIFERAYRASQDDTEWDLWRAAFPSAVAGALHKLFPRYPEPDGGMDLANAKDYLRGVQ